MATQRLGLKTFFLKRAPQAKTLLICCDLRETLGFQFQKAVSEQF